MSSVSDSYIVDQEISSLQNRETFFPQREQGFLFPILADLACKMCKQIGQGREEREKCEKKYCYKKSMPFNKEIQRSPTKNSNQMKMRRSNSKISDFVPSSLSDIKPTVIIGEFTNILCKYCVSLKDQQSRTACRKRYCAQPIPQSLASANP